MSIFVKMLTARPPSTTTATCRLTKTDIRLSSGASGPRVATSPRTSSAMESLGVRLSLSTRWLSKSTSVTIPAATVAGTYYIIGVADANNVLTESKENNNSKAKLIKIGPDLIVSGLSAPGSAAAGSTISVTDTTKNQGADTAVTSTTKFYLSTNKTFDSGDVLLGSRMVPSLAPGATSSGSTPVNIPSGIKAGTYYIIAVADGDGVVPESTESNNTKPKAIGIP